MNINGYVKQYGDKSFQEVPFNYVDGLIFTEIAYINFDRLLKYKDVVVIKDIKERSLVKALFEGSVDARKNKILLKRMIASTRYGDLKISNVQREFSEKRANQFLAFTITLPDDTLFITYRGTDTTLIGWKEDAFLSFKEIIRAQQQALTYAKNILKNKGYKFYLGGHSKGGNLAFYTALNLPDEKVDNLITAFSYDGPGFKDGIKNFPQYEKVIGRMVKFLTHYDVVGLLFNNMKKYKVVKSPGILLGGHDPFDWRVIGDKHDFNYAKSVAKSSLKYSKRVMRWIESLTYEDRKLMTEAIFDIFDENDTIYDLFKNFIKNLARMNKALEDYTASERERLKGMVRRLFGFLVNSSKIKGIKKQQAIVNKTFKPSKEDGK